MKRRKGRESPPEERLYRRLLSHGLEKGLSLELVLETIQAKESNLKLNEKQLRSQIQETIVHACRKGELFIGDSDNFNLRSKEERLSIEQAVRKAQNEVDEKAMLAILKGENLPDEFTLLEGEVLRTFLGFEMVKQLEKNAKRESELRFPDPLVSMAWLMREHFTPEELLDARLAYRRKMGINPFPREYREDLIQFAEKLPNPELSEDRVDLRHIPFVTIDPPDARDFDEAVSLNDNTF